MVQHEFFVYEPTNLEQHLCNLWGQPIDITHIYVVVGTILSGIYAIGS